MDVPGPHTGSVASSLQSVSTGRDINNEAQSVVSQAEGVTSIWPCLLHPRNDYFVLLQGSGEATSLR
jgi:hypothetical protein